MKSSDLKTFSLKIRMRLPCDLPLSFSQLTVFSFFYIFISLSSLGRITAGANSSRTSSDGWRNSGRHGISGSQKIRPQVWHLRVFLLLFFFCARRCFLFDYSLPKRSLYLGYYSLPRCFGSSVDWLCCRPLHGARVVVGVVRAEGGDGEMDS